LRPLTTRDRFLAWLVTGPVGRGVAFVLDFLAAVAGAIRARLGRGRGASD
jgi:hypothetical protein